MKITNLFSKKHACSFLTFQTLFTIIALLMLYPLAAFGANNANLVQLRRDSSQSAKQSSFAAGMTESRSSAFITNGAVEPTTVTVTSSINPSVFGQPVTFTATVASAAGTPTGSVQFFDGPNPIGAPVALNGAGQATVTTSSLTVGSHTITAQYSGDVPAGFNPSSGTLTGNPQVVNKANTTTGLTSSSGNPSATGVAVTFTATVSPVAPGSGTRTGTVTFSRNGVPICSNVAINVNGQAVCNIYFAIAGNYNIVATYSGDGNFNSSTSPTFVQQVVGPTVLATTVTGVTSSLNPSVSGQSVTFTASVISTIPAAGTPTGNVQFFDGASAISPVIVLNASGQAQFTISTLTVGTHSITAQYSGAGNFASSTSTSLAQQVLPVTAANATVSGRIVAQDTGIAIYGARVMMVDSSGQTRFAQTNPFGYYRFDEVPSGNAYVFTVSAKGYRQSPGIVRNVSEDVTDLDIILVRN